MNSNDRSITTLTAVSHALVHTYELSIPIFITVWLSEFGTGRATLGYLSMIGYGLFGLGSVPAGLAADRWDSKTLLLLAMAGMSAAFVLVGIAPNLVLLGLAFTTWGIAASVHHPSSLALISRTVTERGRGFAYHGMAGNFGIAFGPFVTSVLLTFFSWRTVAVCLALPGLIISLLGTRFRVDETPDQEQEQDGERELSVSSFGDFFKRSYGLMSSIYGLLFLVLVLEGLYYRGILTFLPDFFAGLSQIPSLTVASLPFETSKYLYSGMLMLGMLGQYAGGHLSDRYNPRRMLIAVFGLLAFLAYLFVYIETFSFLFILLLSAFTGVVLFAVQPLYQATIAEHTPDDNRGLAYGFTFMAIFGVGALGAGLSGYVLTYYTPGSLFLLLATLVLGSVGLLLIAEWVADT